MFGARSTLSTVTFEEAKAYRDELITGLWPGEELIITRGERLVGTPTEVPRPLPGRGQGMLTIVLEDDNHLKDFAESMP